jgi:hypothetical protein
MSLGTPMRHIKASPIYRWLLCTFIGLVAIVFSVDRGAWFNLKMILASNDGKFLFILLIMLISILLTFNGRRTEKLTQPNLKMGHGDQTVDVPGLEGMTMNAGDEPEARSVDSLEDR